MDQLSVGIDVGSCNNTAYIMNPDKSKYRYFSFENTPAGVEILVNHILDATKARHVDRIWIGMEATSVYADHLSLLLACDQRLKDLGTQVYVINPKLVSAFRGTLPENHKTDKIDAYVIAEKVYAGNLGEPVHISDEDLRYMALRMLTRQRFQAVQDLVKLKQRYANLVFMKCSGLAQDGDITIHSATIMTIIDEFETVDQLAYASHDSLVQTIVRVGRGRVQDPDEYAERVQKAAKRSFSLPKQLEGSVNAALQAIVTSIRAMEKQISVLDDQIKKELRVFNNVLISIPGFGPVYSAGIMAEIGDIKKFHGEASVAKYAGLAWKRHQSSKYESENTRLFQTGNRYLRYYLVEAANSVRMRVPEYANFYDLKSKEVNHHKHKRAITLTARKLVRLVYRLLSSNCLYTPRDT